MKQYRLIASLFILAMIVTACNLPGDGNISEEDAVRFAQETLQGQLDAENQQQPQDQAQPPADQPAAEEAATPTETLIPATATITLTPTPAVPMVSVSTATNCRNGPGIPYDIVGALSPGQNGVIAAQSSVNNYVLIQNPSGGPNCWLWLQHATISGDISSLPVVTPPPSPTPTFTPTPEIDWTGNWTTSDDGVTTYSMSVTQTGNSITATLNSGAVTLTATGTLSANGMTVTGSYSATSGTAGSFTWQLIGGSMDQFNGNYQQTAPAAASGPWCGGRNGAGLPATCLGP